MNAGLRRELEWTRLQAMRPTEDELKGLRYRLQWLRLPAERKWPVKTAFMPGMGRRRDDPPAPER